MKSSTETLIKALEILAREIESPDGVANAAIAEAAERLLELSAERDALRALVDRLQTAIKMTCQKWKGVQEFEATALNLARAINKTDEQCLAEVRAQAGRDGFIAGIDARSSALLTDNQAAIKADRYANQIRQQQVKGE